jgi:DNA polymerase epsilon subunit 4
VSRVQKIINADPERLHTSKNAAFAIAMATEQFIQHLANATHNVVKTERKPRRNIQYRDVASAVAKTDNLEFLVDVVPKTMTYKEFKRRQEDMDKAKAEKTEVEKTNGKEKAKEVGSEGGMEESVDVEMEGVVRPAGSRSRLKTRTSTNGTTSQQESKEVEAAPLTPQRDEPSVSTTPVDEPVEGMVVVEDSEPEQDETAMQIEIEMRGGPRKNRTPGGSRRTAGGFTAINGENK